MDIEKLDINAVCFGILCNFTPVCGEERAKEAVAVVRSLQTENAQLRDELEREKQFTAYYEHLTDMGLETSKKLLANLEKLKSERDAAKKDLETIMFVGGQNTDTCEYCRNAQCYGRNGTQLCNPEWRGPEDE